MSRPIRPEFRLENRVTPYLEEHPGWYYDHDRPLEPGCTCRLLHGTDLLAGVAFDNCWARDRQCPLHGDPPEGEPAANEPGWLERLWARIQLWWAMR